MNDEVLKKMAFESLVYLSSFPLVKHAFCGASRFVFGRGAMS
jgi:hypothetical protein